ncbi:MAG: hypothetical protein GVY07_09890 [Bacteroidetes bacterium]|jgi:hypothetical protein|nr:hypothetical protein [Bacteroidota bacterium]
MSPDEVVGAAIFFGSIVSIVFIVMVGSIIKTWMKKGSADKLSENQEFLEALREFKENMETRMSYLEEIVLDEKSISASKEPDKKMKHSQRAIELELEEDSQIESNSKEENSKLRNMLKQ